MSGAISVRPTLSRSQGSLLSFLSEPYLLIYGGFLLTMLSISFAIEPVHALAMKLRWPALGVACLVGAAFAMTHGAGRMNLSRVSLVLFLVLATASSIYSIDRRYSFERSISIWMLFFATFVGLYAYCQNWRNLVRTTDMLWWIGAFAVIAGALYRHGSMGPGGRYEGIHNRATGAGSYAALFLPLAIYQLRFRLQGSWRLIGWVVVLLLFGQIVLAGARMAIATALMTGMILWIQYYGSRAYAAAIALTLIAPVPFLLNPSNIEAIQQRSERIIRADSISTFTGRLDRWVFGIEQFQLKPVLGHGLGASRTLAGLEDPRRFDIKPGEVFNLHSDQIEVLMDTGIVGYLPFGVFWLVVGLSAIRLFACPNGPAKSLGFAYYATAFYALVDTFMHGGFLAAGGGVSAFSWSMIALLVVATEIAKNPPVLPAPRLIRVTDDTISAPERRVSIASLPSARQLVRT